MSAPAVPQVNRFQPASASGPPVVPNVSPGPPVVAYVSPFKRLMERGQWAALAIILAWALASFWAMRSADVATRVIGHDTVPLYHRRRAYSQPARRRQRQSRQHHPDQRRGVRRLRRRVPLRHRQCRGDAGRRRANITYGDAEKIPITTIMRGVAEYEQFVGQARTLNSEPIALKLDLMRHTILPATEALDQPTTISSPPTMTILSTKRFLTGLEGLVSIAALVLLGYLQYRIFQETKRIINPGLAGATIVAAFFSIYAFNAVTAPAPI